MAGRCWNVFLPCGLGAPLPETKRDPEERRVYLQSGGRESGWGQGRCASVVPPPKVLQDISARGGGLCVGGEWMSAENVRCVGIREGWYL